MRSRDVVPARTIGRGPSGRCASHVRHARTSDKSASREGYFRLLTKIASFQLVATAHMDCICMKEFSQRAKVHAHSNRNDCASAHVERSTQLCSSLPSGLTAHTAVPVKLMGCWSGMLPSTPLFLPVTRQRDATRVPSAFWKLSMTSKLKSLMRCRKPATQDLNFCLDAISTPSLVITKSSGHITVNCLDVLSLPYLIEKVFNDLHCIDICHSVSL